MATSAATIVSLLNLGLQALAVLKKTDSGIRPLKALTLLQNRASALSEELEGFRRLVDDDEVESHLIPAGLHNATRETLDAVMELYQRYESGFKTWGEVISVSDRVQIKRLEEEIDRHLLCLEFPPPIFARIREAPTAENIDVLSRQIEDNQSLDGEQTRKYVTRLRDSTAQDSKDKVLTWVSSNNFQLQHDLRKAARMRDTCEWFIQNDEFSGWLDSGGGVFILQGKVGSGKSVLVSSAIDKIQRAAESRSIKALAYFYIEDLKGNHNTLRGLATSLLRQLLQQLQSLPYSVVKAYDEIGSRGEGLTYKEACLELLDVATMFSRVHIFIDAFNVLAREEQQDLLRFIAILARRNVYVLISSRTTPELHSFLSTHLWRKDWLHQVRISERDLTSDIERLIRAKVLSISRPELHKDHQLQLIRDISTRAEGMFLWVDLILRDLLRQQTLKGMQRCITSIPDELGALYGRFLSQMKNATKDTESIGKLVISILLEVDHPVAFTELHSILEAACSFNEPITKTSLDAETLVGMCGGFVEAEPFGQYLCFIHGTVRDYMKTWLIFHGVNLQAYGHSKRDLNSPLPGFFEPIGHDDGGMPVAPLVIETTSGETRSSNPNKNAISILEQSRLFSRPQAVTDRFAKFFVTDRSLRPLVRESLDNQGETKFEDAFSELLRTYSKSLQAIARTQGEKYTALMVGKETRDIARKTLMMSAYLDNIDRFTWTNRQDHRPLRKAAGDDIDRDERNESTVYDDSERGRTSSDADQISIKLSEDSLHLQRGDAPPTDQNEEIDLDNSRVDEKIEEESPERHLKTRHAKQFLKLTPPFGVLLDSLRRRLQSDYILSPISLNPHSTTLWQNMKTLILAIMQAYWAMILANLRTFWRFKLRPALGGEAPLAPGMKRVRWTCVCDRDYYDDFVEIKPGAAAQLQISLRKAYQKRPKVAPDRTPSVHAGSEMILALVTFVLFILTLSFALTKPRFISDSLWTSIRAGVIAGMTFTCILGGSYMILWRTKTLSQPSNIRVSPDSSGTPSREEARDTPQPTEIENDVADEVRPVGQPGSSTLSQAGDTGLRRLRARDQDADSNERTDHGESDIRVRDFAYTEEQQMHAIKPLWVIPCFDNSKWPQPVQLPVELEFFDGKLFSIFRWEYFNISSRWIRFSRMREVTAIKFVKFRMTHMTEQSELLAGGDFETNVWPPDVTPKIWLYEPCPAAAKTDPPVSQNYLMNIWQDPHHTDRPSFEEWQKRASRYDKAKDWLRHAFPRWLKRVLGDWAIEKEARNPEYEEAYLRSAQRLIDIEQPELVQRNRYAFDAIPKKIGKPVKAGDSNKAADEAWGLYFEEGFAVQRFLFLLLLVYLLAGLIAIPLLYRQAGPLSFAEKAWAFTWLGGFIGLLIPVWMKWAEVTRRF